MSDSRDEMARIRAALESADADLIAALDARARAVREFVGLRERDPEGYHVLPAAAEIIARGRELRKDFPDIGLEPVLREVLGACAEMIADVKVAVLGPEGGFAHLAARQWLGSRAEVRALPTVAEVFAELERGKIAHAVVPFETSTDGAVTATLNSLVDTSAKVVGEIALPNACFLYSRTGNAKDVEKIYGPASTIAACERTLRQHFPKATLLDVRSGLVGAQFALEDHGAAALGSSLLGEIGAGLRIPSDRPSVEPLRTFSERSPRERGGETLRVVRGNVEDEQNVHTRFLVLGNQQPRRSGTDRSMLVLGLGEEPGTLYAALQPFAERSINLTRLESRRAHADGRHVFFVELDGHVSDRAVLTALDEVRARARYVKVLGSYPRPG